jgi:hypothetical protein
MQKRQSAFCANWLRLPNSDHQKVRELTERDQISVNQFIAAVSGKMA